MVKASAEELQTEREIQQMLRSEKKKISQEVKLLLLGAGESGKSTVLKQMKLLYKGGFSPSEIAQMKDQILSNIVLGGRLVLANLLDGSASRDIDTDAIARFNETHSEAITALMDKRALFDNSVTLPKITASLKALFSSEIFQRGMQKGPEYNLSDSFAYFAANIDRITSENYAPNNEDLIRAHIRTSGINEIHFQIQNGATVRMVDVGGQRSERRKWIYCFEDVTAIIFVASLSEYDQNLFEDNRINRMHESIKLFADLANVFAKKPIIVFFNKKDILKEKLMVKPLNALFPEYQGGTNYDEAVKFIIQKFLQSKSKNQTIYTHTTCATDTQNVEFVFKSVQDIFYFKSSRLSPLKVWKIDPRE